MDIKFYEIIKKGRGKKGLTQQQVADNVGANLSTYKKWELDPNAAPSAEYLIKLIKFLDLYYDFFPELEIKKGSAEYRISSLELELREVKNMVSVLLDKIANEKIEKRQAF